VNVLNCRDEARASERALMKWPIEVVAASGRQTQSITSSWASVIGH
jgi:hypothetical protein